MTLGLWRDWKGDLVLSARRAFGNPIPIPIPAELADEPALLTYLTMTPAELKKIWWYRHRMYSQFAVSSVTETLRAREFIQTIMFVKEK